MSRSLSAGGSHSTPSKSSACSGLGVYGPCGAVGEKIANHGVSSWRRMNRRSRRAANRSNSRCESTFRTVPSTFTRGSSIMPSSSVTQRSQPGATYVGSWATPFMYLPK